MILNGIKFFDTDYANNVITSVTFNSHLVSIVPIILKIWNGTATLSEAQTLMSTLRTVRRDYPYNPGHIAFDPKITCQTSPTTEGLGSSYTGYLSTQKPTTGSITESEPSGADAVLRFFLSNIDYYFDADGHQTNDVNKAQFTLRLSGPLQGKANQENCTGRVLFNHPNANDSSWMLYTSIRPYGDQTRGTVTFQFNSYTGSGIHAFADPIQIPCEIDLFMTDIKKFVEDESLIIRDNVVQLVNTQFPQR